MQNLGAMLASRGALKTVEKGEEMGGIAKSSNLLAAIRLGSQLKHVDKDAELPGAAPVSSSGPDIQKILERRMAMLEDVSDDDSGSDDDGEWD
jgi:hypothetical protein